MVENVGYKTNEPKIQWEQPDRNSSEYIQHSNPNIALEVVHIEVQLKKMYRMHLEN